MPQVTRTHVATNTDESQSLGGKLNSMMLHNRETGAGLNLFVDFDGRQTGTTGVRVGPGETLVVRAEDTSLDVASGKISTDTLHVWGNTTGTVTYDLLWTTKARAPGLPHREVET